MPNRYTCVSPGACDCGRAEGEFCRHWGELTVEEAKDLISGWASSTEQEFCVGMEESRALYDELDAVLALIDRLAARAEQ